MKISKRTNLVEVVLRLGGEGPQAVLVQARHDDELIVALKDGDERCGDRFAQTDVELELAQNATTNLQVETMTGDRVLLSVRFKFSKCMTTRMLVFLIVRRLVTFT